MYKYVVCIIAITQGSLLEGSLQLTSSAFKHNEIIPSKYTCEGANISPALTWSGTPANTKSLALIVDDPDAPNKVWVHWILFNIPPTVTMLSDNSSDNSFVQGATDFNGAQRYGGPCPPSGMHRYRFTLYALDTMLNLQAGVRKEDLIQAMNGHILEQTTLIGKYQKKGNK